MNEINSPLSADRQALGGAGSINTALCSFGMSGLVFHAPFITAHRGFNLYAVWERSKKSAAEIYPGIHSFDSLESMLADDAIDLVIVNTPNHTHFDYAKRSLLAGKHVLVEKAFTVTVSEAQELITIAGAAGKQLSVFQNRRYDSDFKTVKKIVDEGLLGTVFQAEFHFDRYKPELSPKQHKESAIPGAGLLYDLGPHLIDQALCMFGMPASVFGCLRIVRPGSIVDDDIDITLFYPQITVRLKAGLLIKEALPAYIVHGINGSFIKERADIQETVLKEGIKPGTTDWGTEPASAGGILNIVHDGENSRSIIRSLQGNYLEFYDGLHEAIATGKQPPVTARDGLDVIRVIEALLESDKTKSSIVVRPL